MPGVAAAEAEVVETAFGVIRHYFGLPAERDVAENETIGSIAKNRLADRIGQPFSLFAAKRVEGDAALETEMVIRFVFAGVKDDGGHRTGPEGIDCGAILW